MRGGNSDQTLPRLQMYNCLSEASLTHRCSERCVVHIVIEPDLGFESCEIMVFRESECQYGWGVYTESFVVFHSGKTHAVAVVVVIFLWSVPSVNRIRIPVECCQRYFFSILTYKHRICPVCYSLLSCCRGATCRRNHCWRSCRR